jgi:hypothetical protein
LDEFVRFFEFVQVAPTPNENEDVDDRRLAALFAVVVEVGMNI